MKIQNFEISNFFRKFFENSKFWIFIDFFNEHFFGQKSKIFGPKIFFDQKFSDFFRRNFVRPIFFRVPIPIQNFPRIPKITLRTTCVHPNSAKIDTKTHGTKKAFFCTISAIWTLRARRLGHPLYSRVPGWRRVGIGSSLPFGAISWIFMFFSTLSRPQPTGIVRDR